MARQPNVVLILVDDMGFSDLGITGSEINTPNIDGLARQGALFGAMYNCARCCPTRASLLTGLYPHAAGIGHMGTHLGSPAYQGYLRNDTVTIAEVLKESGYRTCMSGKWHVGGDFKPRGFDNWKVVDFVHPTPRQRGFDRFYGILEGAGSFFSPHGLMEDETRIADIPDGYYFTDAITDRAIEMAGEAMAADQPFFLYLAHTAPHWPLHAPAEDIARYDGVYNGGWDAIRTARHETLNAHGVLQQPWDISPRDPDVVPWDLVAKRDWEAAKMAAYAGMVDRMDQSVGRLVTFLRAMDVLDNTLILFLSDNGGCAEFMAEDGWAKYYPDTNHDGSRIRMGNIPGLKPGDACTFQSYDRPWANASNAPFRLFKHYVHEGGISTPLVAHWPERIPGGQMIHTPCHVVDLMPTILHVAGADYPKEFGGEAIQPLHGESLVAALEGKQWSREQAIFFEHEGNCAVRKGQFKLVREYGKAWEFYDMEVDRTELTDLAGRYPGLESQLEREFSVWSEAVGVQDWDILQPRLLSAWELDSVSG